MARHANNDGRPLSRENKALGPGPQPSCAVDRDAECDVAVRVPGGQAPVRPQSGRVGVGVVGVWRVGFRRCLMGFT